MKPNKEIEKIESWKDYFRQFCSDVIYLPEEHLGDLEQFISENVVKPTRQSAFDEALGVIPPEVPKFEDEDFAIDNAEIKGWNKCRTEIQTKIKGLKDKENNGL